MSFRKKLTNDLFIVIIAFISVPGYIFAIVKNTNILLDRTSLIELSLFSLLIFLLVSFTGIFFRRVTYILVSSISFNKSLLVKFYKYDKYTYLLLLAPLLSIAKINLSFNLLLLILLIFIFSKFYLLLYFDSKKRKITGHGPFWQIGILFFVSGFATLIYQISWQKLLITTMGSNSESIQIIVSIFMCGLGLGALIGGVLSKKYEKHELTIFMILEMLIGSFGLFSVSILRFVEIKYSNSFNIEYSMLIYIILAIPTILMGTSLPILVGYLTRNLANIGKALGYLYAVNTLGSAIGALLAASFLMSFLTIDQTVFSASIFNLLTVIIASRYRNIEQRKITNIKINDINQKKIPFPVGFFISFATGFISLSHEITWNRILNNAGEIHPQTFGLILFCYLSGVSVSSWRVKELSERTGDLFQFNIRSISFVIFFYFLFTGFIANINLKEINQFFAYVGIFIVAFFAGGIMPSICQISIDNKEKFKASKTSLIYFANSLGSTIGPLFSGYYLLENFSYSQSVIIFTYGFYMLFVIHIIFNLKQIINYIYEVLFLTSFIILVYFYGPSILLNL